MDLGALRVAIATRQALSGMVPFDALTIPESWHRTYPTAATGVPSAQDYTAVEAATLVARFVDPALATASDAETWDPAARSECDGQRTQSLPSALTDSACSGLVGSDGYDI